jgi:hypothetical protein
MNYREAMNSTDAAAWDEEVGREKERFDKYNVLTLVPRASLPADAKVLTTTWAMKKKPNGDLRGRLNARGYEQVDGVHFYGDNISAPVTNPMMVRLIMTLFASNPEWIAVILDVEGAFLQGSFTDGEELYIEIPDGFEKFYGPKGENVLRMNVPMYGTKQAGNCFYKALVKGVKGKKYLRSNADPCLYFIWRDGRLSLMVSWVDDLLCLGSPDDVKQIELDMKAVFKCKVEGELTEYVGSKVDVHRQSNGLAKVKFTQPVLLKKLEEQFDIPTGTAPRSPASEGQELEKGDGSNALNSELTKTYRSGTATMMFMMQWSRSEIYNTVRSLSRYMKEPTTVHYKAMLTCMHYLLATKNRGLEIAPTVKWDGSKSFVWRVHGRSDSNYAANRDDRRSVSGGRVLIKKCPVIMRSATQKFVSLSVTESEGAAGVMVAQDMLYCCRILQSMGLTVELPMLLEMDNKGAVHLANNWSVGGRVRHVDVRNHFLRDLKDKGLIKVKYWPGEENDSDIFTKNTAVKTFEKHLPKFVGEDEYMGA